MSSKVRIELKETGIKSITNHLTRYTSKFDSIVSDVAQQGEKLAKDEISGLGAVFTGALLGSVFHYADKRRGYVSTGNNDYAKYVEFGTGTVGAGSAHPDAAKHGWTYDVNGHGDKGWIYFNSWDGLYHRTRGYVARPFMYNARIRLERGLPKILKKRLKLK